MLCDFDVKQNKYMGGEIVMNLKCISRLSFKNTNNTLEDDIKNSPYTSYFWWHGTPPPPPSAIIDDGGIKLQNCGLFFNLGRNISFRPIFTIDFLYNCISTASYGVAIAFSEYTKSMYKKLYYYDGTLFTFPTTQPLVFNKYRRYTWSSDGKTYRLLNKHLTELGYGSFNCNDLFEFWNEMSENRSACWLDVPENIEDFKDMIGYYEENEENEENEGWEMR